MSARDCGVRVSEVCGLTVKGLAVDQGMALVNGKGSKVRPVYMGARTVRAVDRYLRARVNDLPGDGQRAVEQFEVGPARPDGLASV